jgi:hypothetical protein
MLRQDKPEDVPLVPDAIAVLAPSATVDPEGVVPHAWMIELDSGSERRAVWLGKAIAYRNLRARPALYGERSWSVLAVVPSERRARSIARVIVDGGAGAFTYLGVAEALDQGHAFERVLFRAADLAVGGDGISRCAIVDCLKTPSDDPTQRPPTTVVGGSCKESRAGS